MRVHLFVLVHMCMLVFIHCACVFIYVCMYVCMYVRTNTRTYVPSMHPLLQASAVRIIVGTYINQRIVSAIFFCRLFVTWLSMTDQLAPCNPCWQSVERK